jgi:hypothetical protein
MAASSGLGLHFRRGALGLGAISGLGLALGGSIRRPGGAPAETVQAPSGSLLPENLLRFYVLVFLSDSA